MVNKSYTWSSCSNALLSILGSFGGFNAFTKSWLHSLVVRLLFTTFSSRRRYNWQEFPQKMLSLILCLYDNRYTQSTRHSVFVYK